MAVILLADDERAVRTGMRRFLESEGFTVEVAKEGIEAEVYHIGNQLIRGCIGCGGIADRRTLPGMMLASNAELVAVMDANKALAEELLSEVDLSGVSKKFTLMIKQTFM